MAEAQTMVTIEAEGRTPVTATREVALEVLVGEHWRGAWDVRLTDPATGEVREGRPGAIALVLLEETGLVTPPVGICSECPHCRAAEDAEEKAREDARAFVANLPARPEPARRQPGVELHLDRCGCCESLQLGISFTDEKGAGHGYRIWGDSYAGLSVNLRRKVLNVRDVQQIRSYLDLAEQHLAAKHGRS